MQCLRSAVTRRQSWFVRARTAVVAFSSKLNLYKAAESFVLPFLTTYLAKRGFSAAVNVLLKSRYKIDIVVRGDLRLMLSILVL